MEYRDPVTGEPRSLAQEVQAVLEAAGPVAQEAFRRLQSRIRNRPVNSRSHAAIRQEGRIAELAELLATTVGYTGQFWQSAARETEE